MDPMYSEDDTPPLWVEPEGGQMPISATPTLEDPLLVERIAAARRAKAAAEAAPPADTLETILAADLKWKRSISRAIQVLSEAQADFANATEDALSAMRKPNVQKYVPPIEAELDRLGVTFAEIMRDMVIARRLCEQTVESAVRLIRASAHN